MTHEYTKATFNTDGVCSIVPMTDEEIERHEALMESIRNTTSETVASEPLPDDEVWD